MEINSTYQDYSHITEQLAARSQSETLAVIGLGNMGLALVEGLASKEAFAGYQILLSNGTVDRSREKLVGFNFPEHIQLAEDNNAALADSHMIFMALKQPALQEQLKIWRSEGQLMKDKVIVSLVAGVSMDSIMDWSGNHDQAVVRIMPNTAAAEGNGVVGWTVNDNVTFGEGKIIQAICDSLGIGIQVESDDGIDKITALSGSGIAYFFEMGNQLEKNALKLGFGQVDARRIAKQTLFGAAVRAMSKDDSFETLRNQVTSPNGTTAAALNVLKDNNFDILINNVVSAAKNRATEIGREYANL